MVKTDKNFIDEFLGVEGDLKDNYCSPCKTYRVYSKGKKMLIVRTPLMYDFDILNVLSNPKYKLKIETTGVEEHKRGKYLLTVITYA